MAVLFWGAGRSEEVEQFEGFPYHWFRDVNTFPSIQPGTTLIAAGEKVCQPLRNAGMLHKSKALSTLANLPKVGVDIVNVQRKPEEAEHTTRGNLVVCPAVGMTRVQPEARHQIQWAIHLANRIDATGTAAPHIDADLRYTNDLTEAVNWLRGNYAGQRIPVALDLETMGLDPFDKSKKVVSIQLAYTQSDALVVPYPGKKALQQLAMIIRSPKVSVWGANLRYDLNWLREKYGMPCPSFRLDIQIADSLLDVNRSHALEVLTKIYEPSLGGYDAPMNEKDKGQMDRIYAEDPEGFLIYSGCDAIATYRIGMKQRDIFRERPRLLAMYQLLHRANNAFAAASLNGIRVDVAAMGKLREEFTTKAAEEFERARKSLPTKLAMRYKGKKKFTAAMISEVLFSAEGLELTPKVMTAKSGKPSTAAASLRAYEDHPLAGVFVQAIAQQAKYEKITSTYITGFLKHLKADDKFHPSYLQAWTKTGRLSASSPAMLTLPKHSAESKLLRRCYVPDGEDYAIMGADFDSGELKVIANIADVSKMKEVFRAGLDIHMVTGKSMAGENSGLTDTEIRQRGKSANFGIIYQISPAGLRQYAADTFFVDIPEKDCGKYIDKFLLADYPQIAAYHKRQEKFVRNYGYVESPIGRVRNLPTVWAPDRGISRKAIRAAINSPTQSTLSDLCQLAMAIVRERYPELRVFMFFHDAVYWYVPKRQALLWWSRVQEVMENLPVHEFGWELDLPLTASVEFGLNDWSETIRPDSLDDLVPQQTGWQ